MDPMHSYQVRGKKAIIQEETLFLAIDMGLGKTRITLEAIKELGEPALVIAPLKVALHTWPKEIRKWTPELSFRVLQGPDKLLQAKRKQPDITIINFESVKWLYQKMYDRVIPRRKFGFTAVDESSKIKSHKAQRFKILKAMDALLGKYRVCMSATPMPNGYHELWSQMYVLDQGAALGKTWSEFQRRYFTYTGPPRYELLLRPGADREIMEAVKHKFFRLAAEDYLEMPELISTYHHFDLPKKVLEQYREFAKHSIIELEDKTVVSAASAGAACNKLRQISQGAMYKEDGKTWVELHTERIKALKEWHESVEFSPALVACQFKFEVAMIQRAFGKLPVIAGGCPALLANKYMDQWNAGLLPMMLCHPASISHGVNLQDGGHYVVWFGIPWSLEQYTQLIGRLHRQGQKHGVTSHHIIGNGTVDKKILKALNTKDITQAEFLRMIKEALHESWNGSR